LDTVKIQQVRGLHREIQMVRRMVNPTKVVIEKMLAPAEYHWLDDEQSVDLTASQNEEREKDKYHFTANNRAYIREILDNIDRVIDLIDTYKEICIALGFHFLVLLFIS
jgi:Mg2+ and Co2+ transporter CorA